MLLLSQYAFPFVWVLFLFMLCWAIHSLEYKWQRDEQRYQAWKARQEQERQRAARLEEIRGLRQNKPHQSPTPDNLSVFKSQRYA